MTHVWSKPMRYDTHQYGKGLVCCRVCRITAPFTYRDDAVMLDMIGIKPDCSYYLLRLVMDDKPIPTVKLSREWEWE